MWRRSLSGWLACWGLGAALAAEPQPVVLAVDDAYPPYSLVENEQPAGLYVQLVQRAAQGIPGWQLRLVPMPWARALMAAEQGQVDGFLPPYRGLGREWIASYVGPLHREEVILSCRRQTALGPASQWPADFVGKRIGVMRGYLLSQQLSDAFARQLLTKTEFRNARDALAALASAQIDCYANDRISIESAYRLAKADPLWAKRMPEQLEPGLVLATQTAWVGFSAQSLAKRPELQEFVRALDMQLARLRSSGEAGRLIEGERGKSP